MHIPFHHLNWKSSTFSILLPIFSCQILIWIRKISTFVLCTQQFNSMRVPWALTSFGQCQRWLNFYTHHCHRLPLLIHNRFPPPFKSPFPLWTFKMPVNLNLWCELFVDWVAIPLNKLKKMYKKKFERYLICKDKLLIFRL